MRNQSVKLKITLWLTLLMALLCALLLAFLLLISSSVISRTSSEQLQKTVRHNAGQVSLSSGKLAFGSDFRFYESGVYTLVYSQGETLLAGQLPPSFPSGEAFQNGQIRTLTVQNTRYLILDLWVPSGWENGLWVRGLLEVPATRQTTHNLLVLSAITMPLLLVLSALGAYRILRRALRPLDTITATAASIDQARDLSRRIGLPAGRDEFTRLAATFDHLFERLERSFEAEKQFTSDASHELRTPVSVILGACEYGEKYDETPEERRETLEMIHRQAEKMSQLIAQLLNLTRLDQSSETVTMETVDLCQLILELYQEQNYAPDRLNLELPDHASVEANPALLLRLLQNLVDNAFKYGRPEGHVWISVSQNNQETLLSVRDDGIGIPPDQQDKIWQRFYQTDPSRSAETGAGLGLAMVQQIARIHGGYMTLESQPDAGSTFIFHLPKKNL